MEYDDLKSLTYGKAKEAFEKKGYNFFDKGKFNINVFGIRIKTGTNAFDDAICVAYRDSSNKTKVKTFMGTTDPGLDYLHNPINPSVGTAILVEDQYPGAYYVGHHQGKYLALCQKKKVAVYRDNNKDAIHDLNPLNKVSGIYGINIHRSNPFSESNVVGKWSAGCQVFKKVKDFDSFMKLVIKSKSLYGNSFTYTLFNQEDFK